MAKSAAKATDRVRILQVFVSSPGDVARERDTVSGIVERINDALSVRHGFVLKVWRWEKNAVRRLGASPQKVLDQQTPDYDIYLGIMSGRFGTPGEGYGSGTEKEFRA